MINNNQDTGKIPKRRGDSTPAPQDVALTPSGGSAPENASDWMFVHSTLDDAGLDVYARRIFFRIRRREGKRAGDDGACWEGQERMAEACVMSRQRLKKALDTLETRGFISIEKRFGETSLMRTRPARFWKDEDGEPMQGASTASSEGDTSEDASDWAFVHSTLDDAGLDPYAFSAFSRIRRREGKNGECWEGQKRIAEGCVMSRQRLTKALDTLEARGFVSIETRPGRASLISTRPARFWKDENGEPLQGASTESPDPNGGDTPEDTSSPPLYDHAAAPTREAFREAYVDEWGIFNLGKHDPTSYELIRRVAPVAMMFDKQFRGYYENHLTTKHAFHLAKVARTVTDFDAWFAVLEYWTQGANPTNISGMLDRYQRTVEGDLAPQNPQPYEPPEQPW